MQAVAISFKNGTTIRFAAQSFDIDIANAETQGRILKYTYQDRDGKEAPIYLTPGEVAGIAVSPLLKGGTLSITVG